MGLAHSRLEVERFPAQPARPERYDGLSLPACQCPFRPGRDLEGFGEVA
jgi:hypothetical protein